MGKTMVEQILATGAGISARVHPDYYIINDGVGFDVLQLLDKSKSLINKEHIVVILDHDIPAGSSDSAERQKQLINFARENGLEFIQSKGIGYQLLLDSVVKPGQIVVSCGSHNSIFGVAGVLGIGITPEEITEALQTGILELTTPETVKVTLRGSLPEGVLIKDFILKMLFDFGKDGLNGKAVEFTGSGIETVSYDSKTALCSMINQIGAVIAFFNANANGEYISEYTYDLSELQPMVALPGDLYDIKPASEVKGTPIHAAFVGSCSGGRIEDLRIVSEILKGKHVKRGVRLTVTPISNDVYLKAVEEGIIEQLVDCGAQIINPGCGSCQTQSSGVIGDGENLLSTGCYNYAGCAGTEDSKVYLASTRLVALAALVGCIDEGI